MGVFEVPLSLEIERTYSVDASTPEELLLEAEEGPAEELDLFSHKWEEIAPLLPLLPEDEADYIEMRVHWGMTQQNIGKYYDKTTQAAISYSISRATDRIKFLLSRPKITEEELRGLLTPHLSEVTLNCMVAVFTEGSQILAGQKLGFSQGRVRHRVHGGIARLADIDDPKVQEIYRFFRRMVDEKLWNLVHKSKVYEAWAARRGIDRSKIEVIDLTGHELMPLGEFTLREEPISEVRLKPVLVQPKARPVPKEPKPRVPKEPKPRVPKEPKPVQSPKPEVSSYKPPRTRDHYCKATTPTPHHRGTTPIDETGNTYGDVTVIGRADQSGLDGSIQWRIRCPFGHESIRAGVVLRYKGKTNRCPQCPKTHSLEYRRMRESLAREQSQDPLR